MEHALNLQMEGLLLVWTDKVAIHEVVSNEAWHRFKCSCLDQLAAIIAQYLQQRRSSRDGLPASRVFVDQLDKLVESGILTDEEKMIAVQLYMDDLPLTLQVSAFCQGPCVGITSLHDLAGCQLAGGINC